MSNSIVFTREMMEYIKDSILLEHLNETDKEKVIKKFKVNIS